MKLCYVDLSHEQLRRRRRLELIQDFEFPAAAHRIKATQDGAFIYATGIHPPRVCRAIFRQPGNADTLLISVVIEI